MEHLQARRVGEVSVVSVAGEGEVSVGSVIYGKIRGKIIEVA